MCDVSESAARLLAVVPLDRVVTVRRAGHLAGLGTGAALAAARELEALGYIEAKPQWVRNDGTRPPWSLWRVPGASQEAHPKAENAMAVMP